jgi:hypothetical protein
MRTLAAALLLTLSGTAAARDPAVPGSRDDVRGVLAVRAGVALPYLNPPAAAFVISAIPVRASTGSGVNVAIGFPAESSAMREASDVSEAARLRLTGSAVSTSPITKST